MELACAILVAIIAFAFGTFLGGSFGMEVERGKWVGDCTIIGKHVADKRAFECRELKP